MMRFQFVIQLASFVLILAMLSGCTVFLPGNSYSNERKGEKVNLKLIKTAMCEGLENGNEKLNFTKYYWLAFPNLKKTSTNSNCPELDWNYVISQKNECRAVQTEALPLAAMAASAAIGFATDFIKKKMEEEKSLYTAQYSARQLKDDFWAYEESNWLVKDPKVPCKLPNDKDGAMSGLMHFKTTNLRANYLGFKVERKINSQEENSAGTENQASVFYYGFAPSADRRFLQIRPLSFEMQYSKAKVLSNEWWTWIYPPTLIAKLFKIPAGTIDVELGVDMESYSVGKDGVFTGPKTIASFKTLIPGYKLDGKKASVNIENEKLQSDPGWLLAPPISMDENVLVNNQRWAGNIKLIVNVIERDTSEAPKTIQATEDWISKGGDQLKSLVEKKLGAGE